MSRKRDQNEAPEGFTPGDQIPIDSWGHRSVALSSSGEVICYLGYRRESQPDHIPWYAVSVAARDAVRPDSFRFVRLIGGTITMDSLLSPEQSYRLLQDRFLSLPTGANSHFGVLDREHSEDAAQAKRAKTVLELTVTEESPQHARRLVDEQDLLMDESDGEEMEDELPPMED